MLNTRRMGEESCPHMYRKPIVSTSLVMTLSWSNNKITLTRRNKGWGSLSSLKYLQYLNPDPLHMKTRKCNTDTCEYKLI